MDPDNHDEFLIFPNAQFTEGAPPESMVHILFDKIVTDDEFDELWKNCNEAHAQRPLPALAANSPSPQQQDASSHVAHEDGQGAHAHAAAGRPASCGGPVRRKRTRRRKSGRNWPSLVQEEVEAATGVDPLLAVHGPPTLQQLQAMIGPFAKVTTRIPCTPTKFVGCMPKGQMFQAYVWDTNNTAGTGGSGKQFYLGLYHTQEQAARAADRVKIKMYLCGWRNSRSKAMMTTLNFPPAQYLQEMCKPEVVAMENWATYRRHLMNIARHNKNSFQLQAAVSRQAWRVI